MAPSAKISNGSATCHRLEQPQDSYFNNTGALVFGFELRGDRAAGRHHTQSAIFSPRLGAGFPQRCAEVIGPLTFHQFCTAARRDRIGFHGDRRSTTGEENSV